MNTIDLLSANIGFQIVGGLLLIIILLMHIAFGKKSPRNK